MSRMRIRNAVTRGQRVTGHKREVARSLRRTPTEGEARAWAVLRNRGLDGLKFRRQQLIAGFIADFYCAEHRLVVEVDGDVHDHPAQEAADRERSAVFSAMDIRVVRVRTENVSDQTLRTAIRSALATLPLSRKGEGVGG